MDAHYDFFMIGSSPVSVLEAMAHRDRGEKVAIVDSADKFGGAWRLIDSFGWKNVEVSAHIMRDFYPGYDYLRDHLGVQFEVLHPQPAQVFVSEDKVKYHARYNFRWFTEAIIWFNNTLRKKPLTALLKNLRQDALAPLKSMLVLFLRDAKRGFPKILYPVGGCLELLSRLEEGCRDKGVEIFLGRGVDSINIDLETRSAELKIDGQTVSAKKVGFTRNSKLTDVSVDGASLSCEAEPLITHHAHFLFSQESDEKNFSFARYRDDPYYHMVSDVTNYAEPGERNGQQTRIITAWLRIDVDHSNVNGKEYFDRLKVVGAVDRQCDLLDWRIATFESYSLTNETIAEFETKSNHCLNYVETGDLTRDVESYSAKWDNLARA